MVTALAPETPVPFALTRFPGLLRWTLRADREEAASARWTLPGAIRKPVFLIGAARSGTTFLGGCLDSVSSISYHHEPIATKAITGAVFEGSLSRSVARRLFSVTYASLLASSGHRGRRFCEKTPQNCFLVDELAQWFPDARFVHIVRDGRDAALSYAQKPWLAAASAGSGQREPGGYAWGPYPRFWVEPERRAEFQATSDLHRCIWAWRRFTEAALRSSQQLPASRYVEVRYEELVAEPLAHADRIATALAFDSLGRHELRAALTGVHDSSLRRWERELDAEGTRVVEREAGDLLRDLGYV